MLHRHRTLTAVLAAAAILTLCASCRKQCLCYGYDGTHTYYDKTEVEEQSSGNCSNMRYQSGTRYYSLCEWD